MSARSHITGYWSRFLGVSELALEEPGIVFTEHAGLGDYQGIWFFVLGETAVVSAPPGLLARLEEHCGSADPGELLSPAFARRLLGDDARQIVGPSYQAWLPPHGFRPAEASDSARLAPADADCLREFQASLGAEQWDSSGIDLGGPPIWASYEDDEGGQENQAAGLCQFRVRERGVVDPCILTRPGSRGRGHASRLVGAMAAEALAADQLVLYQTLLSNGPAVAVAERLGFVQYASLLAVRLGSPER